MHEILRGACPELPEVLRMTKEAKREVRGDFETSVAVSPTGVSPLLDSP